ncbi:unnamed protein product [Chrysodeixis includens]|uniref:Uncharacterized protein n=1 Tax=Chrysodeixis includens TaxID=689277 RepID=A0A9P0BKJ2_CHRIL|nr:unnamed protein product [Chrysodeixis includens]
MAETGSEDAPGTYKPKVRWFQIMDTFMRPHVNSNILMMVRQPYTENEVENGNQSGHEWVVVAPGMIPEPSYVLEVSDDSQSSGGHLHTPTYGIAEPRDIHSDTTEDFEQVYPNRSTATQNLLAQVTHAREDDLFDHFGKYIAALLRTKPQERAQKLQAKIVNMIIQDPENDNGRGEPREITEIVETIETLETVVTRTFAADEYPTYQFLPLNPINLSSQFNS